LGKYIQFAREIVPTLRQRGVMWDHAPPGYEEMSGSPSRLALGAPTRVIE
jgi:hypothetical protein